MTAARTYTLFLLILLAGIAVAQEETAVTDQGDAPAAPQLERKKIQLSELEGLSIGALRQQFPRPSGIMAQISSCRLPEYGPLINISLQLPPIYFTGPVLKELEKRSREAEAQASRIREQIDRAAQIIRMKAREAELLAQIDVEQSRKKPKPALVSLQTELDGVRKNIGDLENGTGTPVVEATHIEMQQVDLEKMMTDNYQEALQKISIAMQNVLVESAVNLEDLKSTERICIATHVRDNFLSGQERTILFILNPSDIEDYRSGRIDKAGLRRKILVKDQPKD